MNFEAILGLVILMVSIIAHEVAHGYAANTLGDPTARLAGRLTLNPIPHLDLMGSIVIPALLVFGNSPIFFGWAKPVPYNPYNLKNPRWGEALVAIAGSATNLSLAIIFGLVVRFGASLGLSPTMLDLAEIITFVNIFLGLFNLIPFPPLDGFTALRAGLPWSWSQSMSRFEHQVRAAGIASLILFLIVFSYFLVDPFFILVDGVFRLLIGVGL